MPFEAVAVDAGWLRTIDDLGGQAVFDALEVCVELQKRGVTMLLDHGSAIVAEYERNLKRGSVGRAFYENIMSKGQVSYQTGTPTISCRDSLESDGFDADDIVCVAVAQRVNRAAVYLTHEQSHLATSRRQVVESGCAVAIVGTPDVMLAF